jgi:broad specificity phosphatase PhoE
LVRHGETDWNVEGRVQGHVPTSLNPRGRKQVETLRDSLINEDMRAIYTSDLPRTVETAQIIRHSRAIPLYHCPELREQFYGRWEGRTYKEIEAEEPQEYAEFLQGGASAIPPEGESTKDLMRRIAQFTARVRTTHTQGTFLMVGHGGSLRALILYLLDLPMTAFWRMRLAPASCTVVEVYAKHAILQQLNDIAHYRGLGL